MNISTSLRPPGSLRFGILFGYEESTIFGDPPDENKKMNPEEAESAEFLPWTAL